MSMARKERRLHGIRTTRDGIVLVTNLLSAPAAEFVEGVEGETLNDVFSRVTIRDSEGGNLAERFAGLARACWALPSPRGKEKIGADERASVRVSAQEDLARLDTIWHMLGEMDFTRVSFIETTVIAQGASRVDILRAYMKVLEGWEELYQGIEKAAAFDDQEFGVYTDAQKRQFIFLLLVACLAKAFPGEVKRTRALDGFNGVLKETREAFRFLRVRLNNASRLRAEIEAGKHPGFVELAEQCERAGVPFSPTSQIRAL